MDTEDGAEYYVLVYGADETGDLVLDVFPGTLKLSRGS